MLKENIEILEVDGNVKKFPAIARDEANGFFSYISYMTFSEIFEALVSFVQDVREDYNRVEVCKNGNECVLHCSDFSDSSYCPFDRAFPMVITAYLGCYKIVWTFEE